MPAWKRPPLLIALFAGAAVLWLALALRRPDEPRPLVTPPDAEPRRAAPDLPPAAPRPSPPAATRPVPVAVGRLLDRDWPTSAIRDEMASVARQAGKLRVPTDQRANVEAMIAAHLRTLATLDRHPPQVRADLLRKSRDNLLGGLRLLGGAEGRRPPRRKP